MYNVQLRSHKIKPPVDINRRLFEGDVIKIRTE